MEREDVKVPELIEGINRAKDIDTWLESINNHFTEIGYTAFKGHYKNEDFGYFKTFSVDGNKRYQIGILFYDYRKYKDLNNLSINKIGIQFECMGLDMDCRIDLSISKDITVSYFEQIASDFYHQILKKYQ